MVNYRRSRTKGATYFFTVNCHSRYQNPLLTDNINLLRQAFSHVKEKHPFNIDAIVVLPDHLHCIWTLPENDNDYSTRWGLIKAGFSRNISVINETLSTSRGKRGERGIWQRRFWEHLVRDEQDYRRHVDYIHWNPVKHGWVEQVRDWPHSSFHRFVKNGVLPIGWSDEPKHDIDMGE